MYKNIWQLSITLASPFPLQKSNKTLTLFRMGGGEGEQKDPPTSFFAVISSNVGISSPNFPTFSFNPFATLV